MKRMPLQQAIVIGLAAVLTCFGGAAAASITPRHSVGTHTVFPGTLNISIAVPTANQDYPLYLAKDTGIFQKYGLTVNVQVVGAATIDAAIESGALQLFMETAPQFELAFQSGLPIKMIGMTAEHTVSFLVVRPNIANVAALAGKPVGTSATTSASTIMVKYALHQAGVPFSTVTFVPVTSASAPGAVASGEIDATIANGTSYTQIQEALPGAHSVYNFIRMDWPSGSLWGYEPWLTTHKAEAVAFLRAFNAALVKWNSNPTIADHEISIYEDTSSPTAISADYTATQQVLNKGKVVIHSPSTLVESFLNKVLRLVGFPTAYNRYTEKGQEWTPEYWDAAFGNS